jgi:flagellar L-ring protein precursor FlgH
MGKMNTKRYTTAALGILMAASLSACGAGERLANIGKQPPMSKIENPQLQTGYRPVSMPMPAPEVEEKQPNSLWSANRQTFFKDQRAKKVGDILTVAVRINEKGKLDNKTTRTRDASEDADVTNIFGYESNLKKILPEAVNPGKLVSLGNQSEHEGEGKIDRKEDIQINLAATVTQILPNGNMVIHGSQEVRVNFEKRVLAVDGIIRPEDITVNNTIPSEQIAEARIIYGGQGQLTDVQQPRYGQQLYDVLMPF